MYFSNFHIGDSNTGCTPNLRPVRVGREYKATKVLRPAVNQSKEAGSRGGVDETVVRRDAIRVPPDAASSENAAETKKGQSEGSGVGLSDLAVSNVVESASGYDGAAEAHTTGLNGNGVASRCVSHHGAQTTPGGDRYCAATPQLVTDVLQVGYRDV